LASFISQFWQDQLVAHDRQGLFLVLAGFIASFAFIRMSTRLMRSPRVPWWPGSVVSEGGLHVHHLTFGICFMVAFGALGFALFDESPWFEICATLFGIGAGLTIDEFALWVYLDDVYWSREGRSSIDAAVIAVAAMLLALVGTNPFDVDTTTAADTIVSLVLSAVLLAVVLVCCAKQRLLHAAVGLFVLPVAIYGASRIGKPGSPFARRFYGKRKPVKQAKAEDRFRADRRTERLKEAFRDAVGGTPTDVYEENLAEREVAGHEAAER